MKPVAVRYERSIQTHDYGRVKVGVEFQVEEGETVHSVFHKARHVVLNLLSDDRLAARQDRVRRQQQEMSGATDPAIQFPGKPLEQNAGAQGGQQ